MGTSYKRIAGQSVERLAALSDGIFAVAMTLLVLDLHVPAAELIRRELHPERALGSALVALAPQFLMYLMSFVTLGIFWVGQQTQLNHLERSNIRLSWIHIVFLFFVTIMPFSTALLAEFTVYRTALLAYWLNILCLGAVCVRGRALYRQHLLEHRVHRAGAALLRACATPAEVISALLFAPLGHSPSPRPQASIYLADAIPDKSIGRSYASGNRRIGH